MNYDQFLAGLRLRYIAPHEVTSYASRVRSGVRNELPPEELWGNIVPTLWVVDHLRHAIGKPVSLLSIYRSPAYNATLPGASSRSYHMRNAAIDLAVKGVAPGAVADRLRTLRAAGMFKGGIGVYETFVHVDTRGSNANW